MGYLILGLITLVVLAFVFFNKRSPTRRYQKTVSKHSGKSVPKHTQKQLIAMVGGDRRTVNRLLQDLRLRHPGESETWYWEKAIFDLERDRRY